MNTKAITIFFDPKNKQACNVKVNSRFMKSGVTSKATVIEQAMSWLQASYVKIAHQLLESVPQAPVGAVQPLKRKRGRPPKAVQVEAQAAGVMMKRRRGRPARVNINPAAIMSTIESVVTGKRKVGRPKTKNVIATATVMPSLS